MSPEQLVMVTGMSLGWPDPELQPGEVLGAGCRTTAVIGEENSYFLSPAKAGQSAPMYDLLIYDLLCKKIEEKSNCNSQKLCR